MRRPEGGPAVQLESNRSDFGRGTMPFVHLLVAITPLPNFIAPQVYPTRNAATPGRNIAQENRINKVLITEIVNGDICGP